MRERGLDALVVRAPDNVVYLTNFWGMKGYDAVVFPVEGEATLICLEPSREDAERTAWTADVRLFQGYDERDPRPPSLRALDLAAACDIRVCSADAFFTVQEIHIGMAADLGVLQRLPKIVPPGVAREMAYTGDRLGAERALATGLVNAVLPDAGALHAHAQALAQNIATKSPLAVSGSKRALNYARDHGTEESLQQMTLLQSAIFDIEEMAMAIMAWKAKQKAEFAPLAPLVDP